MTRNKNNENSPIQWWMEKVVVPILLAVIPGYFLLISTGVLENPFKPKPAPTDVPVVISEESPATERAAVPPSAAAEAATEETLSPAVQVMDQYYNYINAANISEDLSRAWDLLTNKLQCSSNDCKFDDFTSFWMKNQVHYKLYDCGSNMVDTELTFYKRGSQPTGSKSPVYLRYTLTEENGQLKLDSGEGREGISALCPLAVSYP